jgi:hypothetical protein
MEHGSANKPYRIFRLQQQDSKSPRAALWIDGGPAAADPLPKTKLESFCSEVRQGEHLKL